ncbi:hypothetical protein P4S73_20935 [Paraglaciecola sp. Hal342]
MTTPSQIIRLPSLMGLLDNIAIDATLQLGYRQLKMELDDLDGIYTDFEFSAAAFVGVEVHS